MSVGIRIIAGLMGTGFAAVGIGTLVVVGRQIWAFTRGAR